VNIHFKCPVCHKRDKNKVYYDPLYELGDVDYHKCPNCGSMINIQEYMKLDIWDKVLLGFFVLYLVIGCCYLMYLATQHINIVIH